MPSARSGDRSIGQSIAYSAPLSPRREHCRSGRGRRGCSSSSNGNGSALARDLKLHAHACSSNRAVWMCGCRRRRCNSASHSGQASERASDRVHLGVTSSVVAPRHAECQARAPTVTSSSVDIWSAACSGGLSQKPNTHETQALASSIWCRKPALACRPSERGAVTHSARLHST